MSLILTVSGIGSIALAQTTATVRVDGDVGSLPPPNGSADGSGWNSLAFVHLQDGLDRAQDLLNDPELEIDEVEIWVAAAANPYKPDQGGGQTDNDRWSTFQMYNNVRMYGGFTGREGSASERDPIVNVTMLSGDLLANDDPQFPSDPALIDDNAFNVVTADAVDDTAVLDGFTVTAGHANMTFAPKGQPNNFEGGGLLAGNSSPTVLRCTFKGNFAYDGAGVKVTSF